MYILHNRKLLKWVCLIDIKMIQQQDLRLIQVRSTQEQYNLLKKGAKKNNRSLSSFMKHYALEQAKIEVNNDK